MNSIEAIDELEKPGQVHATVGRRQAPAAAELMRLYVRDQKRYVLHSEGDFQAVMKEAEQLYKANKDVLVNEKANRLHVHAKSNLFNEVDVGREIAPIEKDSGYRKGKGEVVLESFFEKLPLVDTVAIARPSAGERQMASPVADVTLKEPGRQEPAKVTAEQPQGQPVALDKEVDNKDAANTASKPILKKTGYDLPSHVADVYTVKGGRFYEKGSDKVLFEDHGKKLSTSLEDSAVIAHMVDVTAAKKWKRIHLTGTQNFRQMAWLQAESRGISTSGYQPSEQDLRLLDQAKKDRGVGIEAGSAPQPANNIAVTIEREVEAKVPVPERADTELAVAILAKGEKAAVGQGLPTPLSAPMAKQAAAPEQNVEHEALDAEATQGKDAPIVGRLVTHGRDNFNHDADEKPSYFVTLQTQAGERTVWGKDLERAMVEGQFQAGDAVSLERKGWEPVTVDANVRDGAGKVVGKEEMAARRNVWEAKPAGLVVMRELSSDEQLKVDAAYKVLDAELSKYPAEVRREIVSRFTEAVEKDDLKLPTPQVAQRAEPSRPEPTFVPELERVG
ncbi:LPD7 domain-containing protein [Massilia sp. LXY-6]|uniref:LPD7 domain-containing protein n=1 Tax=Massilia sp. LXY-6 TaxID=3379823 RepID=UPI003EE10601